MSIFLVPITDGANVPQFITEDVVKSNLIVNLRAMLKDKKPDCMAFTDEELSLMLDGSLSYFNGIPHFTDFTWTTLPQRWYYIIIQGAFLLALAAQGLREVGREFNITDNGISFTPPAISSYLQSVHSAQYSTYVADVDKIKSNIKPSPYAVGTFRVLAIAPSYLKLRHLREKRIF